VTVCPKDNEIEENVVYIVKGKGDQISHVPVLSGIRYDGYYIWDKEKYIEELQEEIDKELTKIEHEQLRKEAQNRWKRSGIVVTDPERVFTITPDLT
jgi:hypothetical protein